MTIGLPVKIGLLIARGLTLVGYAAFWALVVVFGFGLGNSPYVFVLLYLIFAFGFLAATAVSISLKVVNLRWASVAWYLTVTAVPLIVSFVRNARSL